MVNCYILTIFLVMNFDDQEGWPLYYRVFDMLLVVPQLLSQVVLEHIYGLSQLQL